ncbi:MAG: hypothetical protein JKY49_09385 [Cohaesibacteraceae bacterium]|nr:hypothetical protein [Cohaesibacteraceae bacterium]
MFVRLKSYYPAGLSQIITFGFAFLLCNSLVQANETLKLTTSQQILIGKIADTKKASVSPLFRQFWNAFPATTSSSPGAADNIASLIRGDINYTRPAFRREALRSINLTLNSRKTTFSQDYKLAEEALATTILSSKDKHDVLQDIQRSRMAIFHASEGAALKDLKSGKSSTAKSRKQSLKSMTASLGRLENLTRPAWKGALPPLPKSRPGREFIYKDAHIAIRTLDRLTPDYEDVTQKKLKYSTVSLDEDYDDGHGYISFYKFKKPIDSSSRMAKVFVKLDFGTKAKNRAKQIISKAWRKHVSATAIGPYALDNGNIYFIASRAVMLPNFQGVLKITVISDTSQEMANRRLESLENRIRLLKS